MAPFLWGDGGGRAREEAEVFEGGGMGGTGPRELTEGLEGKCVEVAEPG